MSSKGLTEVEGLRVGHITLAERPTGCTVVIVDGEGAAGGVAQRGGAPGTRETDLLDPRNLVDKVNHYLLSDLAVCCELAMGTVRCAVYNVRANLPDVTDAADRQKVEQTAGALIAHATPVIQRAVPRIWARYAKPV